MSIADRIGALVFYTRFSGSFTSIGYNARRKNWPKDDFDLANQVWLVTGAYGGIGSAVVAGALAHGASVIAVGRSTDKLQALADNRGDADRIELETVDLSLQAETQAFVDRLCASGRKVDVLVNNVGILRHEYSRTAEGHETTYATNLLNHHLLTKGLIEGNAMVEGARIINVSSGGLYGVPRNTAKLDQPEDKYNGMSAYASHKRAQLALSDHYQQKYADSGCRFYTMHPGWVDTEGVQNSLPAFRATLQHILRDGPQGADTIIWLGATAPDEVTDKIWFDREARTAHAFSMTRKAAATVDEVAEYLDKDLTEYKQKNAS